MNSINWNILIVEVWDVWFRCSLHSLKQCVIITNAEQEQDPEPGSQTAPLQQDVVDLSHHPCSTLLSMQVIVSSYAWPLPPISSTIYSVGNQAFLTFCKGWKTKDLCRLIRLDSVPYLNENAKCSRVVAAWCRESGTQDRNFNFNF